MTTKQASFTLEGPVDYDGHLALEVFVESLAALRDSLKRADLLLHDGKVGADYRVVDLRHSSPATVVVEEVPRMGLETAVAVLPPFTQALQAIESGKPTPPWVDHELLMKMRRISKRAPKDILSISLSHAGKTCSMNEAFRANLDRMLAPAVQCFDHVVGRLLAIDLSRNLFSIFPDVGPERIEAHVPQGKKGQVIRALEKYVRVSGIVSFTKTSPHPTRIIVEDIEVIDDSAAPTLWDLRGIAPNATGLQSSEDFVRRLRDEW